MDENTAKLQRVMNTLQDLDIKSSFDNMNKLLGCLQTLAEVRDSLSQIKEVNVNE